MQIPRRVGILTKHSVPNYGAMLQAHALCSFLNGRGVDTELVDYDQPATTAYFSMKWSFPPRINQWLRLRRCRRFVRARNRLSPFDCTSAREIASQGSRYSHLITGSDQVWFTGPVQYYDPVYFLEFAFPHGRKISYAPSVGGIASFGEYSERVKKALSEFSRVSVRDEHSRAVVLAATGMAPPLVVDPTLLHPFSDLVGTVPPSSEPFLLIFGDLPAAVEAAVSRFAAQKGIQKIISLQYPSRCATRRVAAPSPEEWLSYFYRAAFVVTTYFHGAVFAIKFRKPLLSLPTRGRVKKVTTFLADLAQTERLVNDEATTEEVLAVMNRPMEWSETTMRMERKIADSERFLMDAVA